MTILSQSLGEREILEKTASSSMREEASYFLESLKSTMYKLALTCEELESVDGSALPLFTEYELCQDGSNKAASTSAAA